MFVSKSCQVLFQKGPMKDPWAKNHYKPTLWEKAGSWLKKNYVKPAKPAYWAKPDWDYPGRSEDGSLFFGQYTFGKVAAVVLKTIEFLVKQLRHYGEGKNPGYPVWKAYLVDRDNILQNNTFKNQGGKPKLPPLGGRLLHCQPNHGQIKSRVEWAALQQMEKEFNETLDKANFWENTDKIAQHYQILRDENPSKEEAKKIFADIQKLEFDVLKEDTPGFPGMKGQLKIYFDDVNKEWKRIEKAVKPLRKYEQKMKEAYTEVDSTCHKIFNFSLPWSFASTSKI